MSLYRVGTYCTRSILWLQIMLITILITDDNLMVKHMSGLVNIYLKLMRIYDCFMKMLGAFYR